MKDNTHVSDGGAAGMWSVCFCQWHAFEHQAALIDVSSLGTAQPPSQALAIVIRLPLPCSGGHKLG